MKDNAATIAESMWETIKKEIYGSSCNSREYFHAKTILLNCLSYLEGKDRGRYTDENHPTREEIE